MTASEMIRTEAAEHLLRVVEILSDADCMDDLFVRCDGEWAPCTTMIMCNDVFAWGCSDAERLEPEDLAELKRAIGDATEAGCRFYGPTLWVARKRGERPQGAAYPKESKLWPLFDACGPKREPGLGNPRRHPADEIGE